MTLRRISACIVFLSVLTLSACQTPYPSQAFEATNAPKFDSIAFSIPDPVRYHAMSLSPGSGDALSSAARDDFDNAMKSINFHLGKKVADAFKLQFQQRGFKTIDTTIKPDVNGDFSPADIPTVQADVLIGVNISSAGYTTPLFGFGYGPVAIVTVHAISVKTGETLFRQTYWYGQTNEGGRVMKPLIADSKYTFDSDETLLANSDRAAEGLAALAPLLSKTIVDEIAR